MRHLALVLLVLLAVALVGYGLLPDRAGTPEPEPTTEEAPRVAATPPKAEDAAPPEADLPPAGVRMPVAAPRPESETPTPDLPPRLVGVARDTAGRAVANLALQFRHEDSSAPSGSGSTVTTDHRGAFALARITPPGTWRVAVLGPVRSLVGPKSIQIDSGARQQQVEITVTAIPDADRITGRLLDAEDKPLARQLLLAMTPTGQPGRATRTDPEGGFEFIRIRKPVSGDPLFRAMHRDFKGPFTFSLGMPGRAGEWQLESSQPVAWGSTDVLLRAEARTPPAGGLRIRVVDAETDAPIEAYSLRFYFGSGPLRYQPDSPHQGHRVRHPGPHPGGELKLDHILAGEHRLSIYPADNKTWAPSGMETLTFTTGEQQHHTVRLHRRRTLTLTVTSGGKPLVGIPAELILFPGGIKPTLDTTAWPVEKVFGTPNQGWIYSSGVTDAKGQVRLTGRPSERPFVLKLPGPGHQPTLRGGIELAEDRSLTVDVAKGGSLILTFNPAAGWRAITHGDKGPNLYLVETRTGKAFPRRGQGNQLQVDQKQQTVTIHGVPAGRYSLRLQQSIAAGGSRGVYEHRLDPEIVVDGQSEQRLTREVGDLIPGNLRGVVLRNGKPLADTPVKFVTKTTQGLPGLEWGPAMFRNITVRTDAQGGFPATALPPGDYVTIAGSLVSDNHATVVSDQTTEVRFEIRSRPITLRFVDADGKALTGHVCRIQLPFWFNHVLDERGSWRLAAAPPETFRLRVWKPKLATGSRALLPSGEPSDAIEVRVDPTQAVDATTPLLVRLPR